MSKRKKLLELLLIQAECNDSNILMLHNYLHDALSKPIKSLIVSIQWTHFTTSEVLSSYEKNGAAELYDEMYHGYYDGE